MNIEKKEIIKKLTSKETQTLVNKEFEFVLSSRKSSKDSEDFRKRGNKLYSQLKSDSSYLEQENTYKFYSQSIAFAEPNTDELALAYGNRSALLIKIKKYSECISDIDRSIQISKSDFYKVKLLCRKLECLSIQGSPQKHRVQTEIERLINVINDSDTNKQKLFELFEKARATQKELKGLVKLKKDREAMKIVQRKMKENPFDSVNIKYDEKYGRCLVATKDFNPGDILFIEKPFFKVINLKNAHLICNNCFVSTWISIPCDYCNWCMYCSESCKAEAWKTFHDVECIIVSLLFFNDKRKGFFDYDDYLDLYHNKMLSIKALIVGIREFGSIELLKTELQKVDKCKEDVNIKEKDGLSKKIELKILYTLKQREKDDSVVASSIFILISLIKYTEIFKELQEDFLKDKNIIKILENQDALFVGSLLLKFQYIFSCNTMNIPDASFTSCKYSFEEPTCLGISCCSKGFFAAPLTSSLLHSCIPNVESAYCKEQIIFCMAPIKKDSLIFITYCKSYEFLPKLTREEVLKGHNILCDCQACKENWPTFDEFMDEMKKKNPLEHLRILALEDLPLTKAERKMFVPVTAESEKYRNYNQNFIEAVSKVLTKAYKAVEHQPSYSISILKMFLKDAYTNVSKHLY